MEAIDIVILFIVTLSISFAIVLHRSQKLEDSQKEELTSK